ncbi:sarcosine oxidase subunit beta, partial [Pseudomonas syringae pv. actinidiae ICMP 19096]
PPVRLRGAGGRGHELADDEKGRYSLADPDLPAASDGHSAFQALSRPVGELVRPALLRAADQPWRGGLAHAIEMFPFLANAKLMRQWAGITDMTPDYSPIMGLSPVKNYYLDAGWGTWGFKATPICGKTMAEL